MVLPLKELGKSLDSDKEEWSVVHFERKKKQNKFQNNYVEWGTIFKIIASI